MTKINHKYNLRIYWQEQKTTSKYVHLALGALVLLSLVSLGTSCLLQKNITFISPQNLKIFQKMQGVFIALPVFITILAAVRYFKSKSRDKKIEQRPTNKEKQTTTHKKSKELDKNLIKKQEELLNRKEKLEELNTMLETANKEGDELDITTGKNEDAAKELDKETEELADKTIEINKETA